MHFAADSRLLPVAPGEKLMLFMDAWYNNLTRYRNQRFRTGTQRFHTLHLSGIWDIAYCKYLKVRLEFTSLKLWLKAPYAAIGITVL